MGALAKEDIAANILVKEEVTKLVGDGEGLTGFRVGTIDVDAALGAIKGAGDVLVTKVNVI